MIQRGFALWLGEGCNVPVPRSGWGLGGGGGGFQGLES